MPFDGTTFNPVAYVLGQAQKLCTEESWRSPDHDGRGSWKDGQHCMVTAIEAVTYAGVVRDAAFRAIHSVIGERSVIYWNDREGRILAEVHDAFDRAVGVALLDHP
jgi:hypothetical protein